MATYKQKTPVYKAEVVGCTRYSSRIVSRLPLGSDDLVVISQGLHFCRWGWTITISKIRFGFYCYWLAGDDYSN